MVLKKDLTLEEITALLWQFSENKSEGGNLSKNNDESKEVINEENILLDCDKNEEDGAQNHESNEGEFHISPDGTK